ncbi:hypothetical protein CTI12_AA333780 [Artemisia annua]|uniref:Helitron helicase-like domain-containing protein n=1 Tax=Artemisia annua TaxID=35608 RepID=A0A2U1MXS9_ARTAN|nr:hypothetical protein CTI12_AA333780 [Artemisia annua]
MPATCRVKPVASFESTGICSLPEEQESYSIDAGANRVLANVDDVDLRLNLVSGDACGSCHVTSDVSIGSYLPKRTKCDNFAVNYECGHTSAMLLHQPFQSMPPTTNAEEFTTNAPNFQCSIAATQIPSICSLPEEQESYSIDVGANRVLANVDDVDLRLNLVSGDACGSRHVTSDVSIGSNLPKRTKCDNFAVNYECGHTSAMLLHQPFQSMPPTMNAEEFTTNAPNFQYSIAATQIPSSENLSMIDDICQAIIPEHVPDNRYHLPILSDLRDINPLSKESIQSRGSSNQSNQIPSSMDKGKRKICEVSNKDQPFPEACGLASFSETSSSVQLLCSEDFSIIGDSRQPIMPEHLTHSRQHLPFVSNSHATSPSSNETTMHPSSTGRRRRGRPCKRSTISIEDPPNTGNLMHDSQHLCQPGSSSNESGQVQPIPTTAANLNPSMGYPRHRRQAAMHPSLSRSQQQGNPRNKGPAPRQEVLQIHTYIWADVTKSAIIARHVSGMTKGSPSVIEGAQNIINVATAEKLNLILGMSIQKIDNSIKMGRGPYVFKISGQIYHRKGSLCPEQDAHPQFLQLYIYDTENKVANRLERFQRSCHGLRVDIVENLINVLDEHNELVQLFRTARNKMAEANIPQLKVRLFGVVGSRQHELPTGDSIGAIVFEGGPDVETNFDVVIEQHDRRLKRVNKLNASYMSLQFPLIFLFGEDGYHLGSVWLSSGSSDDPPKKMTMLKFYSYEYRQMEQSSSIVPSSDSTGKEIVPHSEEITLLI